MLDEKAPTWGDTKGASAARGEQAVHLNCPRCGLSIRPRARWLRIDHCPRCLARDRVAVEMFASALPAAELYYEGTRPEGAVAEVRRSRPVARRGVT